jgi:hypothetical protein
MSENDKNRTAIAWPQPPDDYTAFRDGIPDFAEPPVPPAVPFSVFGQQQELDPVIPSLAEQNCPILYDESSPALIELKKLNHRILFAFQRLVGTIAQGDQSPDELLQHLNYLFMNAHYILHKLRPVQALEHMRWLLHEQNRQIDAFRRDFDAELDHIVALQPP